MLNNVLKKKSGDSDKIKESWKFVYITRLSKLYFED